MITAKEKGKKGKKSPYEQREKEDSRRELSQNK